ncbi:hypothetical protein E2C01_023162 [Portunus trituberculatus]|uniref:Uncharacterized protein n=1 Tax=Portunus trituberculatus TaxID=210409 RepID=A0A5B7E907_PORTR|nr:hypothetical protein [Portunus trituberculatus]
MKHIPQSQSQEAFWSPRQGSHNTRKSVCKTQDECYEGRDRQCMSIPHSEASRTGVTVPPPFIPSLNTVKASMSKNQKSLASLPVCPP